MDFWYTARKTYNRDYSKGETMWDNYITWSSLAHLTELISLDRTLNEILVEPDPDNANNWDYIVVDKQCQTGFFTSLEYVLQNTKAKDRFNLLAVVKELAQSCKNILPNDFDFVGYELLDKDYSISALTNCGGFDETFLPGDLNHYGLIEEYEKAFDIRKRLFENNPDEPHAECNVIAVWRHRTIRQEKPG
jgi:hypothetical protein